jgi:predicted nucleic acid-binding protein
MFNEYEFANALRLAAFRKLLPLQSASAYLADFEADIAAGKIIMVTVNLASVIAEARRLSATHTTQGGHRAFDILHVALALHAEATDFFSFDAKQRDLAKAVGLVVND